MWKKYIRHDFEIAEQDEQDLTGLTGLSIYVRNDAGTDGSDSLYSTDSDASTITPSMMCRHLQVPVSLL